tara:strand:+ start:2502 stop:4058 length:1557 start_codon:yes stop_codon:yes gene_type:complete
MSVIIQDGQSLGTGYTKVVNNSLQATGPQDVPDNAGFQVLCSEVNPTGVGVGRVMKATETSEDYRLRAGVDTVLFAEQFLGAALASRNWLAPLTTFTVTVGSGALTLNAGAVTTASAVARVQSQQSFKLWGGAPLYFNCEFVYPPANPATNNTTEVGLFIATGTAAPTDGVLLRYNSAGVVQAVINFNGTETVATVTTPTTNVRHNLVISVYTDSVNFWIDDVLEASIPTPAGRGYPVASGSLPVTFRTYNAGSASSVAVSPQFYTPVVSMGDYAGNARDCAFTNVAMGGMGISTQGGTAVAQSANYANSVAPASATLSNTAAGYTTLGGQYQFATVATAETDYALFAFQVPVMAALAHNKKLVVRGVHISAQNTGAAVATTDSSLQWGVGVGSTAVSLATADATTTKAPHRMAIGMQSFAIAAAIGATAPDLDMKFNSPLVVNPGEFFHVILKLSRGTATASQIIRGCVAVDAEWELPWQKSFYQVGLSAAKSQKCPALQGSRRKWVTTSTGVTPKI